GRAAGTPSERLFENDGSPASANASIGATRLKSSRQRKASGLASTCYRRLFTNEYARRIRLKGLKRAASSQLDTSSSGPRCPPPNASISSIHRKAVFRSHRYNTEPPS